MPPLLTGRNLPQTLLLTALFLLIVVATTMLACGPVAPPAPAADGPLPAAQQSDGGAEPTEEPTETPTVEPTDTPTPNSTECVTIPPEYQSTPELAAGQVWMDGIKYQCFVIMPTPTPKYPELGALNWIAVAGEEAEAQRAAGRSEVEIPVVTIRIITHSNTADVVSWLQNKGLPLPQDRVASDKTYIEDYAVDWEYGAYDFIYTRIPASLLIPLSKQPGVIRIKPAEPPPSPN